MTVIDFQTEPKAKAIRSPAFGRNALTRRCLAPSIGRAK
jgi:hypothetical protein